MNKRPVTSILFLLLLAMTKTVQAQETTAAPSEAPGEEAPGAEAPGEEAAGEEAPGEAPSEEAAATAARAAMGEGAATAARAPEGAKTGTAAAAPATDPAWNADGSRPRNRKASIANELAVSIGATALFSPAIYSGARLIGTSSPNLATSMLPALVFATILPPLIGAGAVAYERHREGVKGNFFPSVLSGLGAQVLVMAGAFIAKTWVADPRDLIVLSAATGVAVGSASTLGGEISF